MRTATLYGLPVTVSNLVPEGRIVRMLDGIVAARLTVWSLAHEGRFPFESRCSRGFIELERERRRRAR